MTTGVQFWITDYWQNVLDVKKSDALIHFSVAAITGPVLGVLIGGYVFSRIGGYESPRAYPICMVVMSMGSFIGFPLPLFDAHIMTSFLLWF